MSGQEGEEGGGPSVDKGHRKGAHRLFWVPWSLRGRDAQPAGSTNRPMAPQGPLVSEATTPKGFC